MVGLDGTAVVGDGVGDSGLGAVEADRAAIAPFEPQPEALDTLSHNLKLQFDPKGILNPGRMAAGR